MSSREQRCYIERKREAYGERDNQQRQRASLRPGDLRAAPAIHIPPMLRIPNGTP